MKKKIFFTMLLIGSILSMNVIALADQRPPIVWSYPSTGQPTTPTTDPVNNTESRN